VRDKKCILVIMSGSRYYCQFLMKLEFSGQIFNNAEFLNFMKNPYSGNQVPCGRSDEHYEA